jgi:hypothetical protein
MYVCVCLYVCVCVYVRIGVCMDVSMCVCVCMYVCVFVYMYTFSMYVFVCVGIHEDIHRFCPPYKHVARMGEERCMQGFGGET